MENILTIVARIEANPDQIELVKKELLKLIPPTLKEKGCIQYDLHQDIEDPAVFLFYENWESHKLWQDHMNSSHLAEFKNNTEDALNSVLINQMKRV